LKTTTWGALIALSAAILVAGLVGYSSWTPSGGIGHPSAQVAEQTLPSAPHSGTSAVGSSSQGKATGRALSRHDKFASSVSAISPISHSAATTLQNPIRSNQAALAQSSSPSNDNGPVSASASPDDNNHFG